MLRGAEMVFAALFAVLLLHRHLNKWHYGGIALCVVRPHGHECLQMASSRLTYANRLA
jgi:hypothetical protein